MGFGCGNLYQNGFKSGQQTNSPNPARAWSELPEIMKLATERLKGVQIENLPALELIKDMIRKMFLFMQIRRIYTELGKIIFINMK